MPIGGLRWPPNVLRARTAYGGLITTKMPERSSLTHEKTNHMALFRNLTFLAATGRFLQPSCDFGQLPFLKTTLKMAEMASATQKTEMT